MKQSVLSRLIPWLLPAAAIGVWQLLSAAGAIDPRIVPAPLTVLEAAWALTASGELFRHLLESLLRALRGLAIGGTIGITFGLLNGLSRRSELTFDTSFQMVRTIPNLAMLPIAILWFGIGEESKTFLIALGTTFPLYVNTFHGVRSVDPKLIEMARSYGLSGFTLLRDIILPGAMPSILVGLRYALGVMWVTLIVAETVAADRGIGYMVSNARDFMQTEIILVGILLYALLGKLADSLARLAERRLLRWNPAFSEGSA
jgi:sulfonate transport system permease protein